MPTELAPDIVAGRRHPVVICGSPRAVGVLARRLPMAMLILRTLGGMSVEQEGRPIGGAVAQRARLAILARLAAAGARGVSRDRLLATFWPESDTVHARGALKQALYAMRRDAGEHELTCGSAELRLNAEVIQSDVSEFQELAQGEDRVSWERAAALYAGPFLDGVFVRDAPEFDRWVEGERERLATSYRALLERLAHDADARGERPRAVTWWRALAVADPTSARIARLYMEAVAAAGDREAAVRHAHVYAGIVRATLEMEPDPEIARLAERLATAPTEALAPRLAAASVMQEESRPAQALSTLAGQEQTSPVSATARTRQRFALLASVAGLGLMAVIGMLVYGELTLTQPHARAGTLEELRALARKPSEFPTESSFKDLARVAPSVAAGALPHRPRPAYRVLVMPFVNHTGDSTYAPVGQIAADWITEGLQRTGLVDVVDVRTARLADRPPGLTAAAAAALRADPNALARQVGATLVLEGSIYRRGDTLEARTVIIEPGSGRLVRAVPAVTGSTADPTSLLAALRSRALGALSESVDARLAPLVSTADVPPRYEAYREYVMGLDEFAKPGRRPYSRAHFLRAAALDSTFTSPIFWVIWTLNGLNGLDPRRRDSLISILAARAHLLSPFDRAGLSFLEREAHGDHAGAYRAGLAAAQLAPASNWWFNAATSAFALGRYREVLRLLHPIDPERGWVRGWVPHTMLLVRSHHALGEFEEQLAHLAPLIRVNSQDTRLRGMQMTGLVTLGRTKDVDAILASLITMPFDTAGAGVVDYFPLLSAEARRHGHAAYSQEIARRCLDWYEREGSSITMPDPGGRIARGRAACLREAGRIAESRDAMLPLLARPRSLLLAQDIGRFAALSARLGDDAAVQRMRQRIREETAGRPDWRGLPVLLEARVAAARGDHARAVEYLRRAAEVDLDANWHLDIDFAAMRGYAPFERLIASRD